MSQRTMRIMKKCIPIFSMLQDERRQEILVQLFDNQEMSVTAVTEKLNLSRPAVSHHLKLLLDAGLVNVRKDGKERYYSLDLDASVQELKELLESIEADYRNHRDEGSTGTH